MTNSLKSEKRILFDNCSQKSFITKQLKEQLNHGTIIRTGITCKKFPCYMRDSACRWFIVENAKIFRSYVKQF